ncbi:MAG: glycoside hydrolase family 5 protein [Thermoguttaceae bacterium]
MSPISRRRALQCGLAAGVSLGLGGTLTNAAAETPPVPLPTPTPKKLPMWRGFNLLEMFNGRCDRFVEDDFRWISDWGFNFVRLPLDYRGWIVGGDWRRINESRLEYIDEAVKFGEKYGVHVLINFHRAPGYTVASPPEAKSVWTDAEALDVCRLHWRTFAKRYRGIGNDHVSFNLFNEPASITDAIREQFIAAHRAIIADIRAEDSDRLIICDGADWGTKPIFELVGDGVAQATRGYAPMEISHYGASWVNSKDFPTPQWPSVAGNGLLISPNKDGIKDEFKKPLVIEGPFAEATRLRLRVGTVSGNNTLVVRGDGATIWEHNFRPAAGDGEWKEVVYKPEWRVYQNRYDRDYEVVVPAKTARVEVAVRDGDWISLNEVALRGEGASREVVAPMTAAWSSPQTTFRYVTTNGEATIFGGQRKDREWLHTQLEPWRGLQRRGCGVIVGEFGAHSPCPHEVALRWMSDMVSVWREAEIGYALWNFRGSFGVLDSNRSDVVYEDFHGHKLDRKMLEVLQG